MPIKEGYYLINFFIMNNEKEMLANFQVEELEKRFEMGWSFGGSANVSHTPMGDIFTIGGSVTYVIN